MSDWIVDWAAPVMTAIVAVAGAFLSFVQYRRANYERAEQLLDYATTGDVAGARHTLGSQEWVRNRTEPSGAPQPAGDALIQALFRVAWAVDRVYAVRKTVRLGPRRLIDEVLGEWVQWWGKADDGRGCRYGFVAAHLAALDPEEHAHLARLMTSMGLPPCPGLHCHGVAESSNP